MDERVKQALETFTASEAIAELYGKLYSLNIQDATMVTEAIEELLQVLKQQGTFDETTVSSLLFLSNIKMHQQTVVGGKWYDFNHSMMRLSTLHYCPQNHSQSPSPATRIRNIIKDLEVPD